MAKGGGAVRADTSRMRNLIKPTSYADVSEQLQVLGRSINFSMVRNPSHLEVGGQVVRTNSRRP